MKKTRGGQTASTGTGMPTTPPTSTTLPTSTAPSKIVNVYLKRGSTGIISGVKPDSPLVSLASTGTNQLTLQMDPSLGTLKDYNLKGHSTSGWTAIAASKLNKGGVTVVVEKSGVGVRRSVSPGILAGQIKLPAVVDTILVKGLEQGNFAAFSATGNAAKGGANIWIQLTFA